MSPPLLFVGNKSACRVAELGGARRTIYFAVRAARLAEENAAGAIEMRYCPIGDMMADALTKTAGASVLAKRRGLCDSELPDIPDITQCYKYADTSTWLGKGLEAST